jgi:hypothetical protein
MIISLNYVINHALAEYGMVPTELQEVRVVGAEVVRPEGAELPALVHLVLAQEAAPVHSGAKAMSRSFLSFLNR